MSLYETRTHSSSLIHFMVFKKISVSHPVPQTRKNSIPKTPSLLLATMIKAHCLPLHAFVGIPTWIIDVKLNISLLPLFSSSSNQNGFSRLNSPVLRYFFNHLQPSSTHLPMLTRMPRQVPHFTKKTGHCGWAWCWLWSLWRFLVRTPGILLHRWR